MDLNCVHSIVSTNNGILVTAVNVLKKRLKNFHVSKSDFCNSNTLTVIPQDEKIALINIESVLRPAYTVASEPVLWNGSF